MNLVEQLEAEIRNRNEEYLPIPTPKKPRKRLLFPGGTDWFRATLNGRDLWGNGWIFDMQRPDYRGFEQHVDTRRVMCLDSKWPQMYDAKSLKPIVMRRYYDACQVIFENRPTPILVDKVGYDYFACRDGITFHASVGTRRHLRPLIVLRKGETEGLLMPVAISDWDMDALKIALKQYKEGRE